MLVFFFFCKHLSNGNMIFDVIGVFFVSYSFFKNIFVIKKQNWDIHNDQMLNQVLIFFSICQWQFNANLGLNFFLLAVVGMKLWLKFFFHYRSTLNDHTPRIFINSHLYSNFKKKSKHYLKFIPIFESEKLNYLLIIF